MWAKCLANNRHLLCNLEISTRVRRAFVFCDCVMISNQIHMSYLLIVLRVEKCAIVIILKDMDKIIWCLTQSNSVTIPNRYARSGHDHFAILFFDMGFQVMSPSCFYCKLYREIQESYTDYIAVLQEQCQCNWKWFRWSRNDAVSHSAMSSKY